MVETQGGVGVGMNLKKTSILALVLALAVLYLTRVSLPSREQEMARDVVLRGQKISELSRIKVVRKESTGGAEGSFTLVETAPEAKDTAGSWYVDGRPTVALDKAALAGFLRGLEVLKVGEPIADSSLAKDFSVYGLDSPSLTVVAESSNKELSRIEFSFGKKNEYLGQRYVKISGRSGVFLTEEAGFSAVNKSLADIREKTPIAINEAEVESIVVASANGTVTVKREGKDTWRITDPYIRPAAPLAVKTLLDSLRSLRATEFIDDTSKAARYGLDTPKVSVKVFFGQDKIPGHREVKIGMSAADGQMAAYFTFNNAPSIFKSSSADLAPFILTADSFREKKVLALSMDEIQSVRAIGAQVQPLEIQATEKEWTVNGKKSDPVFVEQYLTDLASLEAAEFTLKSSDGAFDKPYLTLIIAKKGEQKEEVTLTVGDEVITRSGTRRFVRVGSDGEPVLITDIDAKRIVPHEEALIEVANPRPTPVLNDSPVSSSSDAGSAKP
jgi:hypothetical protein